MTTELTNRLAQVRRELDALSTKLISVARPGHVAYVSKVDAGHTLARLARELEEIEANA